MSQVLPNACVLIRSNVPSIGNYQGYREYLRKDFIYACGYCNITELEGAGISFQIDHYFPQEHYPKLTNEYENLIYSCDKCNNRKSDFFPSKDGLDEKYHIIRPDHEDPRLHYGLDGFKLNPLSENGNFNIVFLNLNRASLRKIRSIRESYWNSKNYIAHGLAELRRIGIDGFPMETRVKFLRLRNDIIEQQKLIDMSADRIIEVFSRSRIIDPDPESKAHLKIRREFLASLKTINLD